MAGYIGSKAVNLSTTGTDINGDANIDGTLTSDGLTVDGAATITVTDNSDTLTLVSTDADATVGPVLSLFRNSASPADNDVLGRIVFKGEDSAGNDATFARIEAIATDVTNGSEDGRIDFFAAKDDSFSAALSITGQNVGIGASPSTRLTVGAGVSSEEIRVDAGAGWADLTLNSNATNGGHIYFNDGSNAGEIFYYHVSNYMAFNTAGSEAMRLDSSGRVGIGVSPSSTLDISAAANTTPLEITAATDGYNYSTIRNAAGNDVGYFGLGSALVPSGSADDFVLRAQRNALVFMSGGNSERMRLNSSGHLLIGKTADDNTTAGTVIHDNGFMSIARSSNIAMILDRHDTDGEILRFTKSGTSVGSIGCNNNDPFIARAGGNGFRWYSGAVVPTNDSGATADNVMDLGSSVGRFKDLYLSGGALTSTVKFLANTTVSGSDATIFRPADNTMAFSTNGAERMRIDASGRTGFFGAAANTRSDITLTTGTSDSSKRWGFGGGATGNNAVFYVINESNVGVYLGHGAQGWTAHSDERIKENITSVGTVLPSLMNMRCVKFNLISNPAVTKIGFIAQDWESAFPEVVDENEHLVLEADGTIGTEDDSDSTTPVKAMAYTETIPLLLKAIQEQQATIEALTQRIQTLENN